MHLENFIWMKLGWKIHKVYFYILVNFTLDINFHLTLCVEKILLCNGKKWILSTLMVDD